MAFEIHLVNDYPQALEVAHELEAEGIGNDVEGVLADYIGNDRSWAEVTGSLVIPNILALHASIIDHPGVRHGLITNNTNTSSGHEPGLVTYVAQATYSIPDREIPYVHKGMDMGDGHFMSAKPSGEQGLALARLLNRDPSNMVLIDDQGVKNAGEAEKAGYKAIVVPTAVGRKTDGGRTIEHRGVMAGRLLEPAIFRSLDKRGTLARIAFQKLAGVDIDDISDFVRH